MARRSPPVRCDRLGPALLVLIALAGAAACGPRRAPAPPAPWTSATLIERGQRALADGDGARAEQYLALAIEQGAPVDAALPLLLEACIAGDRLETALVHAQRHRAAVRDPARLDVLIASLHLALGDQARALEAADDAIAAGDAPALAFYLRGTARRALGEAPRAARADLARYLALAPDGRYRAEARRALAGKAGR